MKATFKPTIENLEDRLMPTAVMEPLYDNAAPARVPEMSAVAPVAATESVSDAADYSAIVFVGGWGSSMYQYSFEGTYDADQGRDTHLAGTIGASSAQHEVGHWMDVGPTGDAAEKDIQKILQNAPTIEEGLCHGVTVLAYARVDGVSPDATPQTVADDVWVDGKIITG